MGSFPGIPTVDGSNPKQPFGMYKTLKIDENNGINYQPQLVHAGFLNHQQVQEQDLTQLSLPPPQQSNFGNLKFCQNDHS